MPAKKLGSRFITYNKLKEAKLTNTNDILKMSLEDAGKIIQDPILQNIILFFKVYISLFYNRFLCFIIIFNPVIESTWKVMRYL